MMLKKALKLFWHTDSYV